MLRTVRLGQRPLRYLIILSLSLPFLLPSQRAYACLCGQPASPEVALEKATAVFSGKVTKSDSDIGLEEIASLISSNTFSPARITFEINNIWKGEPYQTAIINTGMGGGDCGLDRLTVGSEWLVYAYGEQDFLHSNIYMRTRPLADASEDLAILGTGNVPTIAGMNEPEPTAVLGWVLGSCTAVMGFLSTIIGYRVFKRRRSADGEADMAMNS